MLCRLAEWGGKAVARDAFNVEIKILVVSICGDRARATAARKELEGNSYGKKNVTQSLWDLTRFPGRSYVPSPTAERRERRRLLFEAFQFKVSGHGTVGRNGFSRSRTNIPHRGLKIEPACMKPPSSLCRF